MYTLKKTAVPSKQSHTYRHRRTRYLPHNVSKYKTQNINLNGAYVAEKQGQGAEHNSGTKKRENNRVQQFSSMCTF
jgi:hypothetical protein